MNSAVSRPFDPCRAASLPLRMGAAAIAALLFLPVVAAQTTTLHTFNPMNTGEQISAQLVQGPGDTLYGVSRQGGANGNGFVFRIRTDGSGFEVVFAFPAGLTGARLPEYAFILGSDGALYGTTEFGGTAGFGTVYKLGLDGSGFTVLRSFTAGGAGVVNDGGAPRGGLVHHGDGFLFGLTTTGTAASTSTADRNGVLYRIGTDGSDYRLLFSFDGGTSQTNGGEPNALTLGRDGRLYGTTRLGGPRGAGSVFAINTDGGGFTVLHGFPLGTASSVAPFDGAAPDSELIYATDGHLYGTTLGGGASGDGTIYRLRPDGSEFRVVHSFNRNFRIRGNRPRGAFFQGADGLLYGRTESGGTITNGAGILYRVRTDGAGFQNLGNFPLGFPGRYALTRAVDGTLFGAGLNTQLLRIVPPLPLLITRHPLGQTVAPGGSVTFSVEARGATRYQWFRNGATIVGATAASHTLSNLSASTNATYSVLAHNALFDSTSVNAALLQDAEAELSSGAVLRVAAPDPGRLVNLSVRTNAGLGSETLIAGLVIGGAGSKQVVVRGIGPALLPFNIPTALADPRLTIFLGGMPGPTNTAWGGAPELVDAFARVGAFPIPAASRDSALLATLPSGAYSAQVTSVSGATGVALVEVYDADAGQPATRLVNLSARTVAGAGDATLIAGFVLTGNVPRTLLVRGIGPTLRDFIGEGVLAYPTLEIRARINGVDTFVAANTGWADAPRLRAAFDAVGAFPLPPGSGDVALLVSLTGGEYTARIAGLGATTGVALVEIYEVP